MNAALITTAFLWGIASAVSLPLGAAVGLAAKPGRRLTSALMAFGGGALLFALTIELFGQAIHHSHEHGKAVILVTIATALVGGLLFDGLNHVLNSRGAFLRKFGTTRKHLRRLKMRLARRFIDQVSRIHLLHSLPPEEIAKLVSHMRRQTFRPGQVVFNEGEPGACLYFVVSGEIEIYRQDETGSETIVAVLGENDTFGEMSLLSHESRNASARARGTARTVKMLRDDFETLLAESEELRVAAQDLFDQRAEDLAEKTDAPHAAEWREECLAHLGKLDIPVSEREIHEVHANAAHTGGAALAIWLGIMLDGIPESLIIGILAASAGGVSYAFIAGVFLANFPEAMSSAVGMRRSRMGVGRILAMWGSLCLITGIGAGIGALVFPAHPAGVAFLWIAGIEGLAAGAMLTMIAETMLPEAYERGGAIVGMATLVGFLTALLVKVL